MRPKKTILCVDDNEQILSVRTFLLETRGYRVVAAHSAQEALTVLDQYLPGTLDLILCDLIMPQMDGNELVRRAKQLHPGLPAMIVSGTVNAFDRAGSPQAWTQKGCPGALAICATRCLHSRHCELMFFRSRDHQTACVTVGRFLGFD
jgi:two-component system response regulator CpxR